MNEVYLLWHVKNEDTDDEDSKLIGVFSSEQDANNAKLQIATMPGFIDFPNGFLIDPYILNKIQWIEGFISWEEANRSIDDNLNQIGN